MAKRGRVFWQMFTQDTWLVNTSIACASTCVTYSCIHRASASAGHPAPISHMLTARFQRQKSFQRRTVLSGQRIVSFLSASRRASLLTLSE